MQFLVVVPLLRAGKGLNQSLGSLLLQTGDFDLHVHVQSADFSGEPQKIIDRWHDWLRADPASRHNLTIKVEYDRGMYDGIAKAVAALSPTDDCIMTWLGADDVILPGTLATVQCIMSQHHQIKWLTGTNFVNGPDGANCSPQSIQYRRSDLIRGKNDGRSAPFVMQEGTFWRAELWYEAGGVNRDLKLAGDWDLWRRFAKSYPLYTVDCPLGRFSQTAGRLSEDISRFHLEVDSILQSMEQIECNDDRIYMVNRPIGIDVWDIPPPPLSLSQRLLLPNLPKRVLERVKRAYR